MRRRRGLRGGEGSWAGGATGTGAAGPLHGVTFRGGVPDPAHRAGLLLLAVAVGAQALPVVEGRPAAGDVRVDVIDLPDRGIAERAAAHLIPTADEPRQPLWYRSRASFDRHQLPGQRVVVPSPDNAAESRPVLPHRRRDADGARGTHPANLLTLRGDGNGAVALDPGEVPGAG